MLLGLSFRKPPYSILQQEEKMEGHRIPAQLPSSIIVPLWLSSVTLAAAIGFSFGFYQRARSLGPVKISGDNRQNFTYNRIFAEILPSQSDGAWKDILPMQCGFFQHPKLAPERSGLAVFHQLHCLDNIRRGYWSGTYMPDNEPLHEHSNGHSQITPAHVRHCIDYLRQSLMCHADTNIEPIEESLHGVRGFGVVHQCRDFNGVMSWIAEWETEHVP